MTQTIPTPSYATDEDYRQPRPQWEISPPTQSHIPQRKHARRWLSSALSGALAGALVAGTIVYSLERNDTATSTVASPAVTSAVESLDVHAVLAVAQRSVVSIDYTVTQQIGRRTVQGTAAGSGVIISTDGLILTNAHVVSGTSQVNITLNDGTKHAADVVGSDARRDIALLRIKGVSGLAAATLGSSSNARVGDDVIAIGNALDLAGSLTVTRGIISAVERTLTDSSTNLEHLIQTDAAINSGNSGGPLINARGEVIGINTAIIQNSENVGFSIA